MCFGDHVFISAPTVSPTHSSNGSPGYHASSSPGYTTHHLTHQYSPTVTTSQSDLYQSANGSPPQIYTSNTAHQVIIELTYCQINNSNLCSDVFYNVNLFKGLPSDSFVAVASNLWQCAKSDLNQYWLFNVLAQ